ncbi:MAG: BT4734/BF3469 family protein, partial [bacterium]
MNELQDFEHLKLQYGKENLHDIFGTVLDTFPNIKNASATGQVLLWDVLQRIKYNLVYDIEPEIFLLNKYVAGNKQPEYDQKKQQLPAICYNATYNGYKNMKNIKSLTNLMFLDIDDFSTKEEALNYKQKIINKYDWLIACNLSLSKMGLHVVAMMDKIRDNKDYNDKYDYISSNYFDSLLDKGSKSLTRFTVVPYDYDIYINESPTPLNIDKIFNERKKEPQSTPKQDRNFTIPALDEKGLSSVYMTSISDGQEKGLGSAFQKKEIICTPYTFLTNSQKNHSTSKRSLKFRKEVDESMIKDPNIPIYLREGIDVIEVNLFHLKGKKIPEGSRHNFIGAMTVKMIYLNVDSPDDVDPFVRRDILKFILWINKTVCEPPLDQDEIIKSYNANWKRFLSGEMDFSKYFIKKRAFWSKESTLTPNEKRKVTCKIKNEPIVEETKRKIHDGIMQLAHNKKKVTQKEVSNLAGLGLSTVKKYWKEFKPMVKSNNMSISQPQKEIESCSERPAKTGKCNKKKSTIADDLPEGELKSDSAKMKDIDNQSSSIHAPHMK